MTSIRITTTTATIAPTITPMEEESLDDDDGGCSVTTTQSSESVDVSIAGQLESMSSKARPTVIDGEELTQSLILLTTSAAATSEAEA